MPKAVAVDLGATSGRFAEGELTEGRITFRVVEQAPHSPIEIDGRLSWDLDALRGFVRRGAIHASMLGRATLGIDAWGVDIGLLDDRGELILPPVAYRDLSHERAFERLKEHRPELYRLTGCQHQPFNTLYQLAARASEDPSLPDRTARWLPLPDLLAYLETGEANVDLTEASTTNLLALDKSWCPRAFQIAGWPVPSLSVSAPGHLGGYVSEGVRIAFVGSHDTASAVVGLEPFGADEMFLNVGTWSLAGVVRDEPIASPEAEAANLTNERCADGRVRLLKNVAGFWVVNGLHRDLDIKTTVAEWLASAGEPSTTLDLDHASLFNPPSMLEACRALLPSEPENWATVALHSLVASLADTPATFGRVTGIRPRAIRIGGGGSQSAPLCHALAQRSGLPVYAGTPEATVLGNLAVQFLAQRALASWEELREVVAASSSVREFLPC
ncbi:rhamnulokinase family protein [soil metagenome]